MTTTYVPLDPDGNETSTYQGSMSMNARKGKTELQRQALLATRRDHFANKEEHDAFKELEAKAVGSTPDSRVYAAWIQYNIKIATSLNRKVANMTMPKLIKAINNEDKRKIWDADNRAEVLKKLSPTEGKAAMEQRMQAAMSKRVVRTDVPSDI